MKSIWRNEFSLIYPCWENGSSQVEMLQGSYRDAIKKARELVIKKDSPNRGARREVSIHLGNCFLTAIG